MIPTLAQICTLPSPMEADIADYSAAACHSLEIWCGKLDGYLERHPLAELKELLSSHAMAAPVASFQGGLFARDAAARAEHGELFRRRLDQLRQLDVQTLVVVADIGGPVDQPLLEFE